MKSAIFPDLSEDNIKENSISKKKATEFEQEENLNHSVSKKRISFKPSEIEIEEDFSIQEIDEMIEKCTYDIEEIGEFDFDFTLIDEALDIISEKSGISKFDKNKIDLANESKKIELESADFQNLSTKKSVLLENIQKTTQENNYKLLSASKELEKLQKELDFLLYSEKTTAKVCEKYEEIFKNIGISAKSDKNFHEISTNQVLIQFESSGSQRYQLKSNNLNLMYSESQTIYASEMFYFIYRLLINAKSPN